MIFKVTIIRNEEHSEAIVSVNLLRHNDPQVAGLYLLSGLHIFWPGTDNYPLESAGGR